MRVQGGITRFIDPETAANRAIFSRLHLPLSGVAGTTIQTPAYIAASFAMVDERFLRSAIPVLLNDRFQALSCLSGRIYHASNTDTRIRASKSSLRFLVDDRFAIRCADATGKNAPRERSKRNPSSHSAERIPTDRRFREQSAEPELERTAGQSRACNSSA
jgi:hypothetical protein